VVGSYISGLKGITKVSNSKTDLHAHLRLLVFIPLNRLHMISVRLSLTLCPYLAPFPSY